MIHRNTVSCCKALEGKGVALIGSLWPKQHMQGSTKQPVSSTLCGIMHSDQVVQTFGQLIHYWIPCQIFEAVPVTNNSPAES